MKPPPREADDRSSAQHERDEAIRGWLHHPSLVAWITLQEGKRFAALPLPARLRGRITPPAEARAQRYVVRCVILLMIVVIVLVPNDRSGAIERCRPR